MKRRNFLKKLSQASATPFFLGGMPVSLLANNHQLARMINENNGNVLVVLQMHGGNDGLNMVIPVSQYSNYYNLRPNIAIPESGNRKYIELDNTLPDEDKVGIHPDMLGVKDLYDRGRVGIVHGVSYENANGSHFRGRDVFFMGGGYEDTYRSGWMGRFLDKEYPAYPDGDASNLPYDGQNAMKDPPGLEIGRGVSLIFRRDDSFPMSLSVDSPVAFHDLLESIDQQSITSFPDSNYGEELKYIMDMDEQSHVYGERLKEVYDKGGESSITYPENYPYATSQALTNPLSGQFQLIARLLRGGIQTRFFLVRIGGFDTHANQVESYDPTFGHHAALMYHISSAVQAFQADLRASGTEDKVMTITMSEFGRRAVSNGSYGTDHGDAWPLMAFGKWVNPGVFGGTPDLSDLKSGNLKMQVDYRQVLTSVMQNWMGSPYDEVADVFKLDTDEKKAAFLDNQIPIVNSNFVTGTSDEFFNDRFRLNNCYPNPAKDETVINFYINNSGQVKLRLFNVEGKEVKVMVDSYMQYGEHDIKVNVRGLAPGMYIYKLETGKFTASRKMNIVS
ncbi:DUF1501 domain-containing protein [Chondrinema litorale]|uniref:DUF1501 domain-containing protein n=1 Tax=Chondrinema litorale TaxID=2994555 RepID=UPI0025438107|nr:DUF1501 domain-containing protein [Chondrinema litorale]UZR95088.1 DUF1501 domain-containing protein [Chondrinema litorale]